MYFDMYLRDANKNNIGLDLTGTGPYQVAYGHRSSKTFDKLTSNVVYCFALRARTEGGTQGCISAITSNWACARTLRAGEKAQQADDDTPAGSGAPRINVTAPTDKTFEITGSGFLPNRQLQLRFTDQSFKPYPIGANAGHLIRSDGSGKMKETVKDLCQSPGLVFVSATDGRRSGDATGFLWSNTVKLICNAPAGGGGDEHKRQRRWPRYRHTPSG
jgi:hypothetical protein